MKAYVIGVSSGWRRMVKAVPIRVSFEDLVHRVALGVQIVMS